MQQSSPNETENARQPGGLFASLKWYLTHRSPAALLIDATILLILAQIMSHIWSAILDVDAANYRGTPEETLLSALTKPRHIFGTAHGLLFYPAWILAAWAVARQISAREMPAQTTTPAVSKNEISE